MDFIDERLLHYCESNSDGESDLLKALSRETHLKVVNPRMLSGHLQGRFLSFLSQMMRPSAILEIGTYTGYSALCLAEGLSPAGKLITIDPDEETNHFARSYIDRSPYKDRIEIVSAMAENVIPSMPGPFDLVFIDADKRSYPAYFHLVIDKVRTGGLVIADNVLWSGKVDDEAANDQDTLALREFNDMVSRDPRVSVLMLPLRDGLSLIKKR
jgi:caffeoyl-CoA O-methyltransferase